jgi:hypothetical protein
MQCSKVGSSQEYSDGSLLGKAALAVGFWTPAMTAAARTQAAGVEKAPRHEVAGGLAPAEQRGYGNWRVGVTLNGKRDAKTSRRACLHAD